MFSQSLTAQLLRMLVLLGVSLVIVHHSPVLLDSLSRNAVNAGCHQGNGEHHSMSHSQHSEHHH
ncbi:hypothetical protein EOPP23_19365 [Endozoicomonas sp. OPT23]|uniref:hypothetical protein n=1 Tax=Endozoicomonas sp. OPT23 TaxID=2072845 RepID=UPI00129B3A60|nr:hypothetical protein [Endozoicomonas sp. OPT23]MRI35129.1 hypothetical protein [Endozoicomonas sp. OPT23]